MSTHKYHKLLISTNIAYNPQACCFNSVASISVFTNRWSGRDVQNSSSIKKACVAWFFSWFLKTLLERPLFRFQALEAVSLRWREPSPVASHSVCDCFPVRLIYDWLVSRFLKWLLVRLFGDFATLFWEERGTGANLRRHNFYKKMKKKREQLYIWRITDVNTMWRSLGLGSQHGKAGVVFNLRSIFTKWTVIFVYNQTNQALNPNPNWVGIDKRASSFETRSMLCFSKWHPETESQKIGAPVAKILLDTCALKSGHPESRIWRNIMPQIMVLKQKKASIWPKQKTKNVKLNGMFVSYDLN